MSPMVRNTEEPNSAAANSQRRTGAPVVGTRYGNFIRGCGISDPVGVVVGVTFYVWVRFAHGVGE
jgi:preprotein translocase subunit SecF